MENQVAIEVKNVTKSFKVYYDKGKELKEKDEENKLIIENIER